MKMKKLIMFAACAMLAAYTQAAAVGWSMAGATSFVGDKYMFFVEGQNGATSIATIKALLDAGTDVSSYAFGSGTIAANGTANIGTSASGKTLDAGTYSSFFVVFDSDTLTVGETKYAVVSGAANLTKTIGATTANVTFGAANQATVLNNSANWASYGTAVPEPTSGLLMLVGLGALALRRKRA
jgi:hypothetical protein